MTRLAKPIRRAVEGVTRRDVVITLYPNRTIGLREARTRREHIVTIARVFRLAVEMTLEADARDRLVRRNAKRAAMGLAPVIVPARRGKL